jgi:hypothetical protein
MKSARAYQRIESAHCVAAGIAVNAQQLVRAWIEVGRIATY